VSTDCIINLNAAGVCIFFQTAADEIVNGSIATLFLSAAYFLFNQAVFTAVGGANGGTQELGAA